MFRPTDGKKNVLLAPHFLSRRTPLIVKMLTRWCVLILVFVSGLSYGQLAPTYFGRLSQEAQFTFADNYLTKHWWDFYDSTKTTARSDYALMRAEAGHPNVVCLLRLFWFRNQIDPQLFNPKTAKAALVSNRAILEYAQQHDLTTEEGICWLSWCMAVLTHKSDMDDRTRRLLVYDGAIRGLTILEKLPLSVLNQYQGATYDLDYHLQFMSTYFFRIEEYELARRVAMLGNRAAHPVYSTKEGHNFGYTFHKWNFQNEIGSCFLRLGQYKEALAWYQKAYAFARTHHTLVREAISYGTIGVVLIREGNPRAAIPYLERAVAVARQDSDVESEFNAITPLAEAYIALKNYDRAYPAINRGLVLYDSLKHDQFMGPTDSTGAIPLYVGLGEVYGHRGDLKKALFYTQLANRLEANRRQSDDSRRFRLKRERLEAEAYTAKVDQVEADRKRAVRLRNWGIIGLGVSLLVSLGYLLNHRRRRREAENQLALLAQQARDRTQQLAQLQQAPEVVAASTPDDPLPYIAELMDSAILTESDWERFRQLFERVYPNYLLRLRRKYPALTPAETRIICLSRLSLSTREMADMLGVSADTVVKTRYRIRKKANLPEGAELGEAFADL